jgi:hypothetical protein
LKYKKGGTEIGHGNNEMRGKKKGNIRANRNKRGQKKDDTGE